MRFRSLSRLLLPLASAAMPAAANASEWWYVNGDPDRVLFIDSKSIERTGDIATYWTMYVLRADARPAMTKARMEADCAKRGVRYLAEFEYDAEGRSLEGSPARSRRLQIVPPDSLGDAERNFACGDDGDRAANDQFALGMDAETFARVLLARENKPGVAHALHDELAGVPTTKPDRAELPISRIQPVPAPPLLELSAFDSAALAREVDDECGGSPETCRTLGDRYAEGDGVAKNATRAEAYYERGCRDGGDDSCVALGIAHQQGNGVPKDLVAAARAFAEACEKGGAIRCVNLGLAYAKGEGVTKDVPRAMAYFEGACDEGNAFGCSSLGVAYTLGDGVRPDPTRARALFEKACAGGDANGCYNLGVVHRDGLGVEADPVRAVALYEQACAAKDALACGNLARLLQSGTGTAKDPARAAELFDAACDLNDAGACLELGRVQQAGLGVRRDPTLAAASYRRALALDPGLAAARRALASLDPSL